jgi:D-glycero-D-manno-heptose 1,7-bisphosphate phosphatase
MAKALFLDRDGIINVDHGYVYKKENFEFVEGIFDLCRIAVENGYEIIVITNQAGIARGYYSIEDFNILTQWMKEEFLQRLIPINSVYFCPHHPTKGTDVYTMTCKCRKPEPGMILRAQQEQDIKLIDSIFVGDKISDIQAAQLAGIEKRILINSQYEDNLNIAAHRIVSVLTAKKTLEKLIKNQLIV